MAPLLEIRALRHAPRCRRRDQAFDEIPDPGLHHVLHHHAGVLRDPFRPHAPVGAKGGTAFRNHHQDGGGSHVREETTGPADRVTGATGLMTKRGASEHTSALGGSTRYGATFRGHWVTITATKDLLFVVIFLAFAGVASQGAQQKIHTD